LKAKAGDRYILSVDQGTTRTKAVLFDENGQVAGLGGCPVPRILPRLGWVEQDPEVIWESVLRSTRIAMRGAGCSSRQIAAVGIANQGETVVAWNKSSGKPLYNAIVWQCRRTVDMCEKLKQDGLEPVIRKKTGLLVDPYFSATKIRWILDNVKGARRQAWKAEALFGTSDTWLVWKMSHGRDFITDFATASRTMLLNIHKLDWDDEILKMLKLPDKVLPVLHSNSETSSHTDPKSFLGIDAPISGLIVDQQGALFGHGCYRQGDMKNTYGTGCFLLMNTGNRPKFSRHKLLTTVAWVIDGRRNYALDGGVYVAGAGIDWVARELGLAPSPEETSTISSSVEDTGGVFFVPALVGLAAPYWESDVRGTIVGITEGTTRAHIVRATLEAIAYQVKGLLDCMEADSQLKVKKLRVDGGPTSNPFLMQFQADITGIPIEVPSVREVTAQGAAFLAGLAVDFWEKVEDLARLRRIAKIYKPKMPKESRTRLLSEWRRAVAAARSWAREKSIKN